MKKNIFLLTFSLLIFLCPLFAENIAYALQEETSLYKENEKGQMEWALSVPWGQAFNLNLNDGQVITKKAIRLSSSSKVERLFTSISYEEKNYWVQADRISLEGQVGVILEDAALYLDRESFKVSRFVMKKGDVVTWKPLDENDFSFFTEVYWLEANESYSVKHGYVLTQKLSKNTGDLEALKLLKKSYSLKDALEKESCLKEALTFASCEQIKKMIYAASDSYTYLLADELYDEKFPGQISGIYKVEFDQVKIYSLPSTTCEACGILEKGAFVKVCGRLEKPITLDGKKNFWYKIDFEDKSAWIFGSNLSDTGKDF